MWEHSQGLWVGGLCLLQAPVAAPETQTMSVPGGCPDCASSASHHLPRLVAGGRGEGAPGSLTPLRAECLALGRILPYYQPPELLIARISVMSGGAFAELKRARGWISFYKLLGDEGKDMGPGVKDTRSRLEMRK